MAWLKATTLRALEDNPRQVVSLGGHKVLIALHEGNIFAMQSQCPHLKLPLTKGVIHDKVITCPFHRSEFCLDSGEVRCWSPWPKPLHGLLAKISKPKKLSVYPTRIENGEVFADIGD